MNSMHNSFGGGGGGGGGYSTPYPGYMPPSALPYYNGYPGELAASQTPSAYYGKSPAAMAGYSTGMAGYSAPNINNSMYYQQYGLGYQYGYGKYGLGAGLSPALGYGSELGSTAGIAPSSLGGLQAPTTDLGLTGSMFSKGSGSSSNKFSLGNSSPHSLAPTHTNSSMSSAIAQTPPSHSPHSLASSLRGHIATPSPPVDPADCKKDLDKMRRCQLCGQVFRLMSECLAHMKAVHEAPMSMYGVPHSGHAGQPMVPPHMATHSPGRASSLSSTPDSPLMALERMGWGKEQNVMPSLHSSSPLSQAYGSSMPAQQSMPSHQLNMIPNCHQPDPRYGDPSQQSAKRLNDFYNSCTSQPSGHQDHQPAMENVHHPSSSSSSSFKSRKSSSYSVSSIIGENSDNRQDRRDMLDRGGIGSVDPPPTHSPSLPPSLTPNLPITSTPNLPPNLSPNLPPHIHQSFSSSSHSLSSQPPQLAPNTPSGASNQSNQVHSTPPSLSPSYSCQPSAPSGQSPNGSESYQSASVGQKRSDVPHAACNIEGSNVPAVNSYNCSVVCSASQNLKHTVSASSGRLLEEGGAAHSMYKCRTSPQCVANTDASPRDRSGSPRLAQTASASPLNTGTSPHTSPVTQIPLHQTQEQHFEQNVEQETNDLPIQTDKRDTARDDFIASSSKKPESLPEERDAAATQDARESCARLSYGGEQMSSVERPTFVVPEESVNHVSQAHRECSARGRELPGGGGEASEPSVAAGAAPSAPDEGHERAPSYECSQAPDQTAEVFGGATATLENSLAPKFSTAESKNYEQIQHEGMGVECSAAAEEKEEEGEAMLGPTVCSRPDEPPHEPLSAPHPVEVASATLVSNGAAQRPSQSESAPTVPKEMVRNKDNSAEVLTSCNDELPCTDDSSRTFASVGVLENTITCQDPPQTPNKEILECENSESVTDEAASAVESSHEEAVCRTQQQETAASAPALIGNPDLQLHAEANSACGESPAEGVVSEEPPQPSGAEEDIGDDDEPGDPRHPLRSSPAALGEQVTWPCTSAAAPPCASPSPVPSKCAQPPRTPPLAPLPSNASPHQAEQPSQYSQTYYGQQQKLHAPPTSDYQEKSSITHPSPSPKPHQPGPYRGAWPPGYPSTGSSSNGNSGSGNGSASSSGGGGGNASSGHGSYGYQQQQQQFAAHQNCSGSPILSPQPGSGGGGIISSSSSSNSKGPGGPVYVSHSRYPGQYMSSSFEGRRPVPNSYPSQGHWYPGGPARVDGSKSNWPPSWSQSHGYPQSYYYGNGASGGNPPVVSHPHPSPAKYPHQTSPHPPTAKPKPAESNPAVVSPPPVVSAPSQESPKVLNNSAKKKETSKQEASPEAKKASAASEKPRKKRGRPGPKSRVDQKASPAAQPSQPSQPPQPPPEAEGSQAEAASTPQHNGAVSTGALTPPATTSLESSDSSDSDADEAPKLAVLKPAKRFRGPDGSFVGPKRVKLAKMVRQRQHTRQKLIEDQIKQSELEELLTQRWVERASEQEGPLANVLLQSSLLLEDEDVDEPEMVEERIATMTAQLQQCAAEYDACLARDKSSGNGSLMALKKPGRKNAGHKVLHNYNSVVIRTAKKEKFVPKLRAKDFKWSHYIKSMRYWCKDCGHGFKNQKESQQHGEEQCKANCLYMLECYVSVTDIVQHKLYGNKVEELLEEYQVDGEHKCGRCGAVVLRKADFLVHLDTHKDFMPWECTICGTRFKIRGSLKEHLRYTHMKGRVPCLKCNKVFPTSTLLRQHVKVHTQHYKYSRTGKHREEDLRVAREALDDPDDSSIPSDQLSHEANEYRNWCKLMELNAMKNIATSDLIDANKEALDTCAELCGGEDSSTASNSTGDTPAPPAPSLVS